MTQDSEVGVWAEALFLFLRTGSRVRRLTLRKFFFLWLGVPLLPGPPRPPSQRGPPKDPLPQIFERREGKALTQDGEVWIWAEALILCLRTGSRGGRLTLP